MSSLFDDKFVISPSQCSALLILKNSGLAISDGVYETLSRPDYYLVTVDANLFLLGICPADPNDKRKWKANYFDTKYKRAKIGDEYLSAYIARCIGRESFDINNMSKCYGHYNHEDNGFEFDLKTCTEISLQNMEQ